ncbi:MAG TPA: hypothetical protein VH325_17940 [Bryobacteraceae bacterium]|nr:hypothetical protein [Bryobacteraceae bacterium]
MTSPGSYIHWHGEHSPYAVQLKAGLVERIIEETAAAQDIGIETGGVLVGTFPRASQLTVRIDRIIPIERRLDDGEPFVLSAEQLDRFRAGVRESNTRETSAVGFFRSVRGSELTLSAEDLRLSSEEFKNAVHVILLVKSEAPRVASIYLSTGTHAPPELLVPQFEFTAEVLRSPAAVHPSLALTAIEEEEVVTQHEDSLPAAPSVTWAEPGNPQIKWIVALGVLLALLAFAAGFIVRPLMPGSKLDRQLPHSDIKLDLAVVSGTDRVLQITWNHQAPAIYIAKYGTLEIADGMQAREVKLTSDELEAGSVAYERVNEHLLVTLILTMQDGSSVSESCSWFSR